MKAIINYTVSSESDTRFLHSNNKGGKINEYPEKREAKEKVLITNIIRALEKVSRTGNITEFEHVVLVGGSSLDFELGNMVTDALTYYGIISGKANVRETEGPRNAVATGLLLSYLEEAGNGN